MKINQNKTLFLIVILIIGFFIVFDSNLLKSTNIWIKLAIMFVGVVAFTVLTAKFDETEQKKMLDKMKRHFK